MSEEKIVKFSWVETHKEIVKFLAENRDNQKGLIELLKKVGITGFTDKDETGDIELDEIDPFTFFCYFYKYSSSKRLTILQHIARELNISPLPTDESGIPSTQPQQVWMFPFKSQRKNDEIKRLWDLFFSILSDNISASQFEDVLKIQKIGKTKLTEALFKIAPEKYFPINGPTKPYLKEKLNIDPKFETLNEYFDILKRIQEKTSKPFYELSYDAWVWNTNRKKQNYWIFQGNPKFYDFESAFSEKQVHDWIVTSHKDKIKPGDKVIIWITGAKPGCYALAEVTEEPGIKKSDSADKYWKTESKDGLKAEIKITHNLVSNPITRETIDAIDELSELKAGNQGTNFEATEDQYTALLELAEKQNTTNSIPLNTILYGPPGTGKTYKTILRAARIIENRNITDYSEAQRIFNEHIGKRIEFITFHQNYSYEDFIQGLRPDIGDVDSLKFERKDGVFKRIAIDALFEYFKILNLSKKKADRSGKTDNSEIYLSFVEHLKSLENKTFYTASGSTIYISEFTKNDNIKFKHVNSNRSYLVSGKRLLKLFSIYPQLTAIKNVHNDIRDAIGGCNTTVFWVALREFINFYNQYHSPAESEIPEEEEYEDFEYDAKKRHLGALGNEALRQVHRNAVDNYVIIIDEINRANISRVFGELITLIETDKRSHGDIPLKCKLPSSDDEEFIVPSNLYIIGTMNTADKSIALLDIALRRRFVFEPVYPEYDISGHIIHDVAILKKINQKIRELKGPDYQIGHAYFMGDDNSELVPRMNNKVIPLLLEYFMNDEKEVKAILESAGLEIQADTWPLQISGPK